MADAISRFPREEHGLVHISSDGTPAEMSGEGAVTHQDDVVQVGLFFCARSAMCSVTTVVVHADDRALVKRTEDHKMPPACPVELKFDCY